MKIKPHFRVVVLWAVLQGTSLLSGATREPNGQDSPADPTAAPQSEFQSERLALKRQPGKGAGPRLDPITRVEIMIDRRAELDRLTQAGYDVAGVDGNRVLLYADSDELATLQAGKWSLKILEPPKPPADLRVQALDTYNNYTNMTALLDDYVAAYPSICRKTSLGQSVRGRELWAMKITSHPDIQEDKPEVKFVSTLHGNEYEATEVCLHFIDLLLKGYAANDARVVNLVNNVEIWIVPLMNPDGREARPANRYNANGYDLNRSFPNMATTLIQNRLYGAPLTTNVPPEVRHIMTWTEAQNFSLAVNFHTGGRLVCYPYGDDGLGSVNSPTPDDGLFRGLALTYATNNPAIRTNSSPSYPNGVINDAAWFSDSGMIEDWGYRYDGCLDICVELTTYQANMPASQIPMLFAENRESMLAYAEWALKGVRGILRDARTEQPVYAAIRVEGIHNLIFSDRDVGDYHRILPPGRYTLWFYAPGYITRRVPDVIVGSGEATRLDVGLEPVSSRFAVKINFQPVSTTVPTDYLADTGAAYGYRPGGYTYGWETELSPANMVVRRAPRSRDLRYDTICRMQAGSNHLWEIAVPNGPYSVLVAAGDPSTRTNRYQIYAEDVLLLDSEVLLTNRLDCNRWVESLGTVMVTDGRLTLSNGSDATNNQLAFVELSALEPATIAQWRAVYFATTNNAGPAAANADPDGDGLPNLLEYVFALNPVQADPAGQLAPTVVRKDGAEWFGCEFPRNTAATDLRLIVEASSDLSAREWFTVASYQSGVGWSGPGKVVETPTGPNQARVTVFDVQPTGSRGDRFMRLAASSP